MGKGSAQLLKSLNFGQLLLEDLGTGKGAEFLQTFANEVFPYTSFAHTGSEFFGRG
jgi:hypothetical protein